MPMPLCSLLPLAMLQIVADRGGCDDDRQLAEMGPGSLLEVGLRHVQI